jgi:SNF2 family DNA or RNA helicase
MFLYNLYVFVYLTTQVLFVGKPFPHEMNDELKAMHHKMNNMGDIKTFHILVLLLRLRQICCHPGLIESVSSYMPVVKLH